MINLDKSENWSSWADWVEAKKVHYGSKTGLQVYGGMCLRDKKERQSLRKDMFKAVKGSEKKRRNGNE